MENQAPSGAQAAALLRRPTQSRSPQRDSQRVRVEQQHRQQQAAREKQEERQDSGEGGHVSRFSRPSALIDQHKLPVVETDQFRVVEPDGTEDPWASADDGLVPDKPSHSPGSAPQPEPKKKGA